MDARRCAHFMISLLFAVLLAGEARAAALTAPPVAFAGETFAVEVRPGAGETGGALRWNGRVVAPVREAGGVQVYELTAPAAWGPAQATALGEDGAALAAASVSVIPAAASLAPPLVAIVVALALRSVLPALFLGVWAGAWLVSGLSLKGLGIGFLETFQRHAVAAMTDPDHVAVILFTLMMGGMIGIIMKNGGMAGLVKLLTVFARGPRSGQMTISGLGFAIFFDDIANTLLIGNTMRPVADRLRISREKLAYLVDSTAAPLASVAFATTWIGYEVSLIESTKDALPGFTEPAYSVFLNSLAYSFYPFLALLLVWVVAVSGRDFGPMLTAERRARRGAAPPDAAPAAPAAVDGEASPPRALNAIVPILILVATLVCGLYFTGEGDTLRERVGSADSFKVLMWASFLGAAGAGLMSLAASRLTLEDTIEAWHDGLKTTLFAMLVLVLSWAISDITQLLDTAGFLVDFLGERMPIGLIPAAAFLLSAAIAFTTGTSWGTMGIMLPLILPFAWAMAAADGSAAGDMHIVYAAVAAVLTGAVFGDHCSPISDTTVLSSLASGCDHIEHVRTQMPYALLAAALSVLVCAIPIGFGAPWFLCLALAAALLIVIVRMIGKRA